MNARKHKQVAYDEHVSQAEDEIAGINCDIADFLSGMSSTGTITVCINAGESMKKNETIIGGQFWQQEGRSMTAVNGVVEGMPNTRESAILSAAAEAVEWRHPIESVTADGKRATPRIVICPADISPIEEALSDFSQNPSEAEDGSHIALSKILEHAAEYASPPRFLREDSSEIQNDPELAAAAPIGLSTAAQVSVGSRDYVLENGPDVMNSSDEDSPQEERGEVLTGMYTSGLSAPVLLFRSEVAHQSRSQSVPSSPTNSRAGSRFDTPNTPKSSNPFIPRAQTRTGEVPPRPTVSTGVTTPPLPKDTKRRQKFLSDSSGASGDELPPPAVLLSSKVVPSDPPSPSPKRGKGKEVTKSKVAASPEPQEHSTVKEAGRKATARSADSEGTHPMTTRQRASRAGGLRGESGSRATDTCVASSNPSET
jgi:hypothetical protein